MVRVFLAGGIASGKTTVARLMERRGASRIDLDDVSRAVLAPGSPVLAQVAERFGEDVLDASGALNRPLLAQRAFARDSSARELEALELPAIRAGLEDRLRELNAEVAVVEVPLLDRVGDTLSLADEVVAVVAPLGLRRERALARGMDAEDFNRRAARQPDDAYLRSHASAVFDNVGDEAALEDAVFSWWDAREASGWAPLRGGVARG